MYIFPPWKAFGNQTNTIEDQGKKQSKALKSVKFSDEMNESKQIESTFLQNWMIDFIIDKLKGTKQIQNLIKLDELDYVTKK